MLSGILENLPHREPFRFVSSVEELEAGRRGVGVWDIRGNEDFFSGHFPAEPIVPGVLLAESLAQLSGLVAFADAAGPATRARLAQVNVKFMSGVTPPARVRLISTLVREMSGLYLFEVEAKVHDAVVAAGSLVLAKSERTGVKA